MIEGGTKRSSGSDGTAVCWGGGGGGEEYDTEGLERRRRVIEVVAKQLAGRGS